MGVRTTGYDPQSNVTSEADERSVTTSEGMEHGNSSSRAIKSCTLVLFAENETRQMLRRIDGKPFSGRLVYRRSDRALDVEPRPSGGVASLQLNTVQIEIDEEGRLLYVWGYCPHESWEPATLDPPAATPGRLQYIGWTILRGASIQLNADKGWAVGYDSSSQWLCLGDASARAEMIAFAPDAVAALNGGKLVALWLHPDAQG